MDLGLRRPDSDFSDFYPDLTIVIMVTKLQIHVFFSVLSGPKWTWRGEHHRLKLESVGSRTPALSELRCQQNNGAGSTAPESSIHRNLRRSSSYRGEDSWEFVYCRELLCQIQPQVCATFLLRAAEILNRMDAGDMSSESKLKQSIPLSCPHPGQYSFLAPFQECYFLVKEVKS